MGTEPGPWRLAVSDIVEADGRVTVDSVVLACEMAGWKDTWLEVGDDIESLQTLIGALGRRRTVNLPLLDIFDDQDGDLTCASTIRLGGLEEFSDLSSVTVSCACLAARWR